MITKRSDKKGRKSGRRTRAKSLKEYILSESTKIAKDLYIDISDITSTSKSKWKNKVKEKSINRI